MSKTIVAGVVFSLLSPLALADDAVRGQGDWILRAGYSYLDTDSGTDVTGVGTVGADSAGAVTFNGAYMITDNLAVELLAATPFSHDLEIDGVKVGETKHLPPTLSAQWHIPIGDFVPYVGLGVNWTVFFDEELNVPDSAINLDDSTGLAAQVGLDWILDNNWLVNFEVRYIDIETEALVSGAIAGGGTANLGDISIDPWLYGFNVGYQF